MADIPADIWHQLSVDYLWDVHERTNSTVNGNKSDQVHNVIESDGENEGVYPNSTQLTTASRELQLCLYTNGQQRSYKQNQGVGRSHVSSSLGSLPAQNKTPGFIPPWDKTLQREFYSVKIFEALKEFFFCCFLKYCCNHVTSKSVMKDTGSSPNTDFLVVNKRPRRERS